MVELKDNRVAELARESTTRWDKSPKLEGKIKFPELRQAKRTAAIITELQTREAMSAGSPKTSHN